MGCSGWTVSSGCLGFWEQIWVPNKTFLCGFSFAVDSSKNCDEDEVKWRWHALTVRRIRRASCCLQVDYSPRKETDCVKHTAGPRAAAGPGRLLGGCCRHPVDQQESVRSEQGWAAGRRRVATTQIWLATPCGTQSEMGLGLCLARELMCEVNLNLL